MQSISRYSIIVVAKASVEILHCLRRVEALLVERIVECADCYQPTSQRKVLSEVLCEVSRVESVLVDS